MNNARLPPAVLQLMVAIQILINKLAKKKLQIQQNFTKMERLA